MIDFPVYTVVFLLYVLAHDPDFPSKEYWDEQTLASFCRYLLKWKNLLQLKNLLANVHATHYFFFVMCRPLFCFIEALVNEDNVNGDPDLVTETFSYLFGLLRAIEKADAVDAQSTSVCIIFSANLMHFSEQM